MDFSQVARALHLIGYDGYLVVEQPTSADAVTQANLSYLKRMMGRQD
jgi:sugar phosphate isomerase/epimerase